MPTTFTLPVTSAASAGTATVTLAQIEREVAPRVGPYRQLTLSGGAASPATVTADAITSSIELGGYEDLYVLRRGLKADGSAVPGFVVGDRVRQVKTYTPSTGTLSLDRAYSVAPIAQEVVELHHLHPADELRPAVLDGLGRCYFVDRADVTLSGQAVERDLGAVAPWITDPSQVLGIGYAYQGTGSTYLPVPQFWRGLFVKNGSVWLALTPDPYPNTLLVTSRRAHSTWVNGATSTTGPTADADTLAVDLAYAAAAGHIEAWRLWRDRLEAAAAEGARATQADAAAEFTRQARLHYRPPAAAESFDLPFGAGSGGGTIWRNSLW